MSYLYISFLIPVYTCCLLAQTAIEVPVLAVLHDASRGQVRAVKGVPGAATVAEGVDLRFTPTLVASAGSSILAAGADQGTIRLITLQRLNLHVSELQVGLSKISGVALSPSTSSALLLDQQSRHIQAITGLPLKPVVHPPVAVEETADSGSSSIAVSDDGSWVAVASATSVWGLMQNGSKTSYALGEPAKAIAFRPGTHDLLVLTATGTIIQADAAGLVPFSRVSEATALDVAGMQVSADGGKVFIAFRQGRLAVALRGAADSPAEACACNPEGLVPTLRPGLFLLSGDVSKTPLLAWDVAASVRRVWFIPDPGAGVAQ